MDALDPAAIAATTASGGTGAAGDARAVEREKVRQLAQQFESLLIANMLREMRKTVMSDDEERPGLGADVMTDTIDTQLGDALSKAGGIGLANVMLKAFDRGAFPQMSDAEPVSAPATLSPQASDTGNVDNRSAQSLNLAGTVTSSFGWRRDPFSGATKFHAGTDLRAAYGSEVHAAGSGTVTFAGERPGYGMTVVIDHGQGLSTRYAHLSGYTVGAGDEVGSGQVVARTGNSGRSTGPHLHVELLRDGQPVDPGTMIKGVADVADSKAYRSDREEHTR